MESDKFGRIYHFPFSPGTTSDDRFAPEWNKDIKGKHVILSEKLDGSNTAINVDGVYGRSHAAPSKNPWDEKMWEIWRRIKNDLGTLEIFGENMVAVHSIIYDKLTSPLYVFAIRDSNEEWLSWEEVKFYANLLDLPVVPVLGEFNKAIPTMIQKEVERLAIEPSTLGIKREGLVVRNASAFMKYESQQNIWKWVRAGHVKTDEHWAKNWQKAKINYS